MIEELVTWHNEEFWPTYCKFLETPVKNKWGPGGKGASLAKVLTKKPSKELREKIMFELIAQMRHRRELCNRMGISKYLEHTGELAKSGNGSVYKNRQATTYINQMGWFDEIPSIDLPSEVKKKFCHCGKPVHGPSFNVCTQCLADGNLRLVK